MKNIRLISSQRDRAKETVELAHTGFSGREEKVGREIEANNSTTNNTLKIAKKDMYHNLLGFDSHEMEVMNAEFDDRVAAYNKSQNADGHLGELEVQNIICEQFLKGKYVSSNPYSISQKRLGLLLKGFSSVGNGKNMASAIGIRHGDRKGPDLTDTGRKDAFAAGQELEISNLGLMFGTHQTVIESMLISLVGGSKGLNPKQAWTALPDPWKEPYKTAQITEFQYFKEPNGKKRLCVITNNAGITFTEDEVKSAYDFIKNYNQ